MGADVPSGVEPAASEVRAAEGASKLHQDSDEADPALATRVSKFNLLPLPAGWQGSFDADDGDPRVDREVIIARFDPESYRNTKGFRLWMGGNP